MKSLQPLVISTDLLNFGPQPSLFQCVTQFEILKKKKKKKRGKKEKKKEKKKKEKKNSLNTKGSMEEMPLCR